MLKKPRNEINLIDEKIVKLLEERYTFVDDVVKIKKENNLPTLDANREEEVINRLSQEISKKEYEEAILKTFQSIMDISKEYQKGKHQEILTEYPLKNGWRLLSKTDKFIVLEDDKGYVGITFDTKQFGDISMLLLQVTEEKVVVKGQPHFIDNVSIGLDKSIEIKVVDYVEELGE